MSYNLMLLGNLIIAYVLISILVLILWAINTESKLGLYILLAPFYSFLFSIASIYMVFENLRKPNWWNKTKHKGSSSPKKDEHITQ